MTENQGNVEVHFSKSLAQVEFYHPKANSLPSSILDKLTESFKSIAQRDDIKAVVLKSRGDRTFCAGASFDEFKRLENAEQANEFFLGIAKLLLAIIDCPQLVIARLQGKAVGGGVGLAAACDYVFALNTAAVRLSELELGIGPFTIGPVVERRVGKGQFSAMTIDTQWRDAQWCLANGLFSMLYEQQDEMDQAIEKFLDKLLLVPSAAIAANKRALWSGASKWDTLLAERAEISGRLLMAGKDIG